MNAEMGKQGTQPVHHKETRRRVRPCLVYFYLRMTFIGCLVNSIAAFILIVRVFFLVADINIAVGVRIRRRVVVGAVRIDGGTMRDRVGSSVRLLKAAAVYHIPRPSRGKGAVRVGDVKIMTMYCAVDAWQQLIVDEYLWRPVPPCGHANQVVVHHWHVPCVHAVQHLVKRLLPALKVHVYIPLLVHFRFVVKPEIAEEQGQPFHPEAGPSSMELPVQPGAVKLSGTAEEMRIGMGVQLERMAPYVALVKQLRSVGDGYDRVLRQTGILRTAACKVKYLQ